MLLLRASTDGLRASFGGSAPPPVPPHGVALDPAGTRLFVLTVPPQATGRTGYLLSSYDLTRH